MLEEVRFGYLVIHRQSHVDAGSVKKEKLKLVFQQKGRLAFKRLLSGKTMTCDVIGAKWGLHAVSVG